MKTKISDKAAFTLLALRAGGITNVQALSDLTGVERRLCRVSEATLRKLTRMKRNSKESAHYHQPINTRSLKDATGRVIPRLYCENCLAFLNMVPCVSCVCQRRQPRLRYSRKRAREAVVDEVVEVE